jgi:hypothetical protein
MTEQLPDEQTVVSTSTHTSMPFCIRREEFDDGVRLRR